MANYGYVRVPPGGGGLTRAEQEATIRGAAQMHGGKLDRIFVDEGVGGWVPAEARPAGKALCDAVEPYDRVYVAKLHKLFRSAADALSVLSSFRRRDIGFVVAEHGPEPINLSGAGRVFFELLKLTAEFERERLLEQPVTARPVKSLQSGLSSGVAPFGFRVEGGRLVEHPEEQQAIRTMIRLRADLSLRKIAEEVFNRHAIRISHEGVRQVLADFEARLSLTGEKP